jgi:hypothetical protein
MGYLGSGIKIDEFREHFEETKSRGPDDTRILQLANGILGFHRLAIMGLTEEGMQPFLEDGCSVVCNGELYGFEKMKAELESKGYTFSSGSDCELLLPLWFEYGTDMFNMLDAEFALVLIISCAPSALGQMGLILLGTILFFYILLLFLLPPGPPGEDEYAQSRQREKHNKYNGQPGLHLRFALPHGIQHFPGPVEQVGARQDQQRGACL